MNSIRRQLLLTLIGAISLIMLLGAWATFRAAEESINTIFDYHLEQIALSLRDQTFQGSAEALSGEKDFDFVIRVWDRNGLSLYYSQPHRVLPNIARLGYATEQSDEGRWRVYTLQARGDTIAVAQPMRVRARLAATAALRTLAPFLVLLPLLALLIWLVVNRALRPLTELAASVSTRTPDALDPFAEAGVPEESQPLVRSLNELLARLRTAIQAQREFIADAAHELRTPLTALQLQTQLVERASSEAERAAAVHELKLGLARTIHLVHQLLTLARQEPGAAGQSFTAVSLAALIAQVVAEHAALAADKNIDLGVAASDPATTVHGDREALRTLLANLVGNALRYTPAGGCIDVSCGDDAGAPFLQVLDNGPGIPPAERERVFDRFYRHSSDGEPGSGLGLAIVRSIAERHGAHIALADGDDSGHGLRVRLDFPGSNEPL